MDILQYLKDQQEFIDRREGQGNIRGISTPVRWLEMTANILVAPRQTGKSTALSLYADHLHDTTDARCLLVSFSAVGVTLLRRMCQESNQHLFRSVGQLDLAAISHYHTHLLVDEFLLLPREVLGSMLDYPWRTVTMVGSLGDISLFGRNASRAPLPEPVANTAEEAREMDEEERIRCAIASEM